MLPRHSVEHKKSDGDGDGQQWENVVHARSKALKILAAECELSNRTKFPGLPAHFESRLDAPDPLVISYLVPLQAFEPKFDSNLISFVQRPRPRPGSDLARGVRGIFLTPELSWLRFVALAPTFSRISAASDRSVDCEITASIFRSRTSAVRQSLRRGTGGPLR